MKFTGLVTICALFMGFYLLVVVLLPVYGISVVVILLSMVFFSQGIFTLKWMLHAWENPEKTISQRSPNAFLKPSYSFSALIPARNEEAVIGDTIKAVNNIDYPDELKEILILCRQDDTYTILAVNRILDELGKPNIKLVVFDGFPINKPHSLNIGLQNSGNQIVTVFDAEDQPHRDIYKIINTLMTHEKVDVIQSGVQLMNYRSHWFSALNVLEYFFWFKSGLNFFSQVGNITPLGGNTVFFKKNYLELVGGWDENCLTEDADIGIRLAAIGAKLKVIYDEKHVTREETPDSTAAFIKQRTRWDQGFLQILLKGNWTQLPQLKQKLVSLYTLSTPVIQILFLLYFPFGVWLAANFKLPVLVSLISFVPMYIFILQILIYLIGIREFTREYKLDYSFSDSLKIIISFFPYQIILATSSFRGLAHLLLGKNTWEKTTHINAHRNLSENFLSPLLMPKTYAG